MRAHFARHFRFYTSLAIGVVVWILGAVFNLPFRHSMAGNAFFVCYLLLMFGAARRITPADMRRRAKSSDEGIILIILITIAAIGLSLGSIFSLLNSPDKSNALHLVISVFSLPLGWTTLHTIMAFHYAHLFYAKHPSDRTIDAGGLGFPKSPEPGVWDFLYYSFVVGMTAQVSDVQVLSTGMRRVTLAHGVVAFFYNAVILALAVNVAVVQGH